MDGYKSRLDALQAAILRAKLRYIDQWNERRRQNAALYNELLQQTKVITPYEAEYGGHIYNYYVICSKDRDNLQSFLKSKGIDSAVYYPVPLHLQPVYSNLGYSKGDFSISEQVSNEVLALPMFPELTQDEIKYITKNVEL
jgi:dTDP-4-amino-4,6-dideoxygalactose transaminase